MRRRILCLALTLCLTLTACGGSVEEPPQSRTSLWEEAAGVEEETVLLTVNGQEIPAWRYLCWLYRACEAVSESYAAAGKAVDWSQEAEGQTLADYVKAQALSDTALYAVVEQLAEQHDCPVPPGKAPAAQPPLSAEQTARLADTGRLYAALYEDYCTEGSTLAPTAEELAAFAAENGWAGMEQICVPFGEDKEEARQRAAELFSRLNAAEDSAAVFSELRVSEGETVKTDGEDALLQALAALEAGQYSGILEGEEAYVILRRVEPDPAAFREEAFDRMLLKKAAEAEICCTQAYKELDAAVFWRTFMEENARNL